MIRIKSSRILIAVACALAVSCASGPDMYIAKEVSAEDKGEFLFNQGVARYEELLVEQNDLTSLPRVRKFFENALLADPLHPKAEAWIAKVDAFGARRYSTYMARAKTLNAKGKRTAAENYEMVRAIKLAGDVKSDSEHARLRTETSDVRKDVIGSRVSRLSSLETKIVAEKRPATLSKLVPQATRLQHELDTVDPGNPDAKRAISSIDNHVSSLAKKDIDEAKRLLNAKRYGESEKAVLRAESTIGGFDTAAGDEVKAIKYQLYIRWGNALYTLKKFGPADEKAAKALSISRTAEAVSLKAKINKASTTRSYDAEIDDILADIDGAIARGELTSASAQIKRNTERMKRQANKDKLASRNEAIVAALKPIYDDGIAAYNEEDYELARDKLRTVVRIKADYEQAQGYLDRANGKLKALSGTE